VKNITFIVLAMLFVTVCPIAEGEEQDEAKGLTFGMTVENREAGLLVVAIDEGVTIGKKLLVRDLIVSYRLHGAMTRPISVFTNAQLEEIKRLLESDKAVDLTVLRPDATDDKNPSFNQVTIILRASDLRDRSETKTAHVVKSYTATTSAGTPEKEPTHTLVDVFYGTDRSLVDGQYVGKMDSAVPPVKYGVCRVSIPKNRRPGELRRPSWWPLDWQEDPTKHVLLRSVNQYANSELFFESLSDVLRRADGKRLALVYVHGYNNDFEEAALRTAQLHYDLGFPGVSCFFSWPSDGTVFGYKSDEEDIQVAMPHIRDFIASLEGRPDIDEVFVLAHSMGNRGVVNALVELVQNGGGKKVRELILAAPDINADVFNEQIAPVLAKHLVRTTVYASNRDRALWLSQNIGGYPRAGEVGADGFPAVRPLKNLDVCDSTIVDADFWGHSAYGASPTVLSDLWELMMNSKAAEGRRMLEPVTSPNGLFFRLKMK